MTSARSPAELAQLFADIGSELDADQPAGVLEQLVEVAVRRVDGAEYGGVTIGRHRQQFETVAASSDLVRACDKIQYELGSGPCVDAVLEQTIFNAPDLRVDPRWPEFGRRSVEETGIVSMLSLRLFVETDRDLIAGLNLYAHAPAAFDENSEAIAQLLATHAALDVAKATAEEKVRNLDRALQTSRRIGTAIGILMALHKVTSEQAFDMLRIASQTTHRKLADIADWVVDTGALPERRRA